MAVITTSFLAAVKCDCGRAILARHSSVGHRSLCRVLDAQHSAEMRFRPPLRQSGGVAAGIRWIGGDHIVSERVELLRKSERRLSMDRCEVTGAQRLDVLLQSTKAFGILLHEIRGDRTPR